MNIQAFFSPSGGICWSKNVCLVLTGQAGLHGLCLVRSLLAQNSMCRKIKVVEKRQIRDTDRLLVQTR